MAPDRALSEAEAALPVVAPTPWTALAAITGNAAQVGAAVAEVRQRLRPIARVRVVTDALLDFGYRITHRLRFAPRMRATAAAIAAIRPLHGLTQGVPTDAAVDALLWQFGDDHLGACDFDRSKCGLVYISPALPGDGAFVASVVAAMEAEAARFGHELGVTINVETGISVVAVTNIVFDRTDQAQAGNARACVDALLRLIRERGLEVYRAHTDMMDGILAADPEYWRLIRELKRVFDPDNIIAPGRYCPVE
jgi:4-cresol dehydrogenase (hydroxylating)